MNKRLIIILMFFFALLTPLIFNGPSRIYEVFAGGPIAPSPFGPGPVVPPGGEGGGAGTTIPVQTPVAGRAFNGWNGTSFDTVVMPTAPPTASPVPASTPVAGQAVTGFGAGVSSVSRGSFQAPIPISTPVAGKAYSAWNGTSFDTMDVQVPLPTATPTANYVFRGWNGTSFDASQLDYSELANPPALDFDPLGTAQALITSSTSDPSPTPCTGLQGNFWRKVDSGGAFVDLYQCDCEGADNATNCVWHSNVNPVDVPLVVSGGHLTFDISSLSAETPNIAADYIVFYDATDGAPKKALINTISPTPAPTPTATITRTAPMKLMTVSTANAYTYVNTVHGTNLDYAFVAYVDAQTGDSFWIWHIPDDLATVPAWAIVLTHRATPTATGNVVLSVLCSVIQTASDYDVALRSVFDAAAVATSGTSSYLVNSVLVKTGTDNDSTLALVAGATLTCKVERVGGDGSDTISAIWQLFDVSVRYNAKIN